jgi:hypothetical protein
MEPVNFDGAGPKEPELSRFYEEAIYLVQEELSSESVAVEATRGEMMT